jgi:hypothetical protein
MGDQLSKLSELPKWKKFKKTIQLQVFFYLSTTYIRTKEHKKIFS